MKKTTLFILFSATVLLITGCRWRTDSFVDPIYDDRAPQAPRNVEIFNGDGVATVIWDHSPDSDVKGYRVHSSSSFNGRYDYIATVYGTQYDDYGVHNGSKYFYAVTAYDYNGNESDLSYDYAYAVPRPEGFGKVLNEATAFPASSGYDFSGYRTVAWNSQDADVFFEKVDGIYYLSVFDDTDIQDMGSTRDIYDIAFAPESGWAPNKTVKAVPGRTYVLWLWDNTFAKIRVKTITADRLVFDWAYQTVEGEPQLKPVIAKGQRKLSRVQ
ncbi:MAG: hypothetical protein IPG53_08230 [Ignavibacteriales bacterium]|nr:hypothetical protein [Ignavibacteriales bacterium]